MWSAGRQRPAAAAPRAPLRIRYGTGDGIGASQGQERSDRRDRTPARTPARVPHAKPAETIPARAPDRVAEVLGHVRHVRRAAADRGLDADPVDLAGRLRRDVIEWSVACASRVLDR